MRKWAEKESLDIFRRRWEGVRGGVGIGEFPRYDQKGSGLGNLVNDSKIALQLLLGD